MIKRASPIKIVASPINKKLISFMRNIPNVMSMIATTKNVIINILLLLLILTAPFMIANYIIHQNCHN